MKLNVAKISRFWGLLIVLIMGVVFSACNGGATAVSAQETPVPTPSSTKAITSYSLNGMPGVITGKNITVTMSLGTSVESLVATFTTTGEYVSVNDVQQISGVTVNNFTEQLVYVVTAEDGSTTNYTVTVTVSDEYLFYMDITHVDDSNSCSAELAAELTHDLAVDPQVVPLTGYYDIDQGIGSYDVVNYQDLGVFALHPLGIEGAYDFGGWSESDVIIINAHTYPLHGISFSVPGSCSDESQWGTCGVLRLSIYDYSLENGSCILSSTEL